MALLFGVMSAFGPAPDAVWSRRGGRRHAFVLLFGVILLGVFVALGVNAFLTQWDGAERVIGGIITGFFACLMLFCAAGAVRLLLGGSGRLPSVAVDSAGVWFVRGPASTLVAWPEIAAVGIGYLRPPRAAVVAGSSLGLRKNFALEVFPRGPMPSALAPWSASEPPPRPDLPTNRLRYVLLLASDRSDLAAAITRFTPALWLGEYERQWTPLYFLNQ